KSRTDIQWTQYFASTMKVAGTVWRIAPSIALFQIGNAILGAILPLATTYLAALTTTALAEAFAGDDQAGQRAIHFLLATAGLGLVSLIWRSIDQYINQLNRYRLDAIITDQMHDRFLNLAFWRYDDKDNI